MRRKPSDSRLGVPGVLGGRSLWGLLAVLAACGGDDAIAPACDEAACAAMGQLCEGDGCVDPWRYGDPQWSTCADEPRATAESLAEKAAIYDARGMALHVRPGMPWLISVDLMDGVDPTTATWEDVAAWRTSENDGLWGALYLASQAYRYAVTRDEDALSALRILIAGEQTRMRITRVSGLFTRQLIPPGVPGIACPADPALYVPTPDKRGNRWVRIGDDGCAQVADAGGAFASTEHCDLDELAGWCFLDNVSQDEYVGHMFALAAVARLVDVADVRDAAVEMLRDIGWHLMLNDMELVDWDGRATQWGKVHPGAAGDTPGYLAVMGLSFLAVIADATGDATIRAYYDDRAAEYPAHFGEIDVLSAPDDACGSNWNNISMLAANAHHLLWHERDPARRAVIQDAIAGALMEADSPRAGEAQRNAWLDIMWAAQRPLGPGTDGPAYDLVEDAVCQLRQFPASNHRVARDPGALAPEVCTGRSDESLAATPFDVADRCAEVFVWWKNPYDRAACEERPIQVEQPAGYTLPYWMARYYGFVDPGQ